MIDGSFGAGLRPLLAPRSVAILGASDDPGRIGGKPLAYTKTSGFSGGIYPINPNRETVQGLPAFGSVADLPEAVDCAIVAVPAKFVSQALRDCADKGIKSCLIFSAGFSEMGDDGDRAQDEIREIVADTGLRVQGPNCLGLFNAEVGWYATFTTAFERELPSPDGPIAFATQSGAYGSHLCALALDRNIGVSRWISTGNEADVELAECIAWFAEDENTKVIVAQAEGARNGDRLRHALNMAREREKPVLFVKIGRSDIGAEAAKSHTAALAGADNVYDALFRQAGAYRVDGMSDLLDILHAAEGGIIPSGKRLGIMSISGGLGIQMSDTASDCGLDMPAMPEEAQKKALETLPFSAPRNPFDVTAQAINQPELLIDNLRLMLNEGDYDSVAIFLAVAASSKRLADILIPFLEDIRKEFPDRFIALSLSGPHETVNRYREAGYPWYEDGVRTIKAIAALTHFGQSFGQTDTGKLPDLPAAILPPPAEATSEIAAKSVIASTGIRVSRDQLATSADEAMTIAGEINGRVVLKIASPDIGHKTEIGGVIVGLEGDEAIRDGFETIMERARAKRPDAKLEGVIVSEMIEGGVETVIGLHRDPLFGPVIMFGLGGVFVEVLKDVTFRVAPFSKEEAYRMIDEIKGRAMLDGVRGADPSDIDALAEALSKLSVYAEKLGDSLEGIDLNPFIVLPKGKGAVAVDALILPREEND